MIEPLRVAIIGAGKIAQLGHLPGYLEAGAEIAALCDNNHPGLEDIASAFHVRRCYRDWREMLAEGGFQAVSICTPPFLHAEMAVECAKQDYDVLVEKPMAVSLEECDRMIAAANEAGVLLMVSLNQRYLAAHQIAKEILASGMLGKPYLVHGVFGHSGPEVWSPTQQWYFRPERAGLGVLADLGYHKIDLVRWMTGQEVVQISAFTKTFEKGTTLEDTAVLTLSLSGGTLVTLQVSWVFRPDWENSLVIRCEQGVIRVPTEASEPVRVLRMDENGRQVESTHVCVSNDPSGWFGAVKAFVTAIQTGSTSPVAGIEGRAAQAAVFGAAESAKFQRTISLI